MIFSYLLLVRESQSRRKHRATLCISVVFCCPLEMSVFMELAMASAQTHQSVHMGNTTLVENSSLLKM